jgi:Glycosyltransferase family 17
VRVFDTFLFAGIGTELDMLECRLTELEDCVDLHVIVEGTLTFQGNPKPLAFQGHRERFARWADRIAYVPFTPGTRQPGKQAGDHWAREHASRQAAWRGLTDAEEGDIVIHGDVDEIPTPAAVASLREHADEIRPCKLRARWANFAVDWLMPDQYPWTAPSVMRFGQLGNLTDLRETGWPLWPYAVPGSWHLTWLGGREAISEKVGCFSHPEAASWISPGNEQGQFYERGVNWAAGDRPEVQQLAVDVDETWPQWIWRSWDPEGRCRRPEGPAPAAWFRPREPA